MRTFTSRILRSLCVVGLVLVTLVNLGGAHTSAAAPPAAPWGDNTTSFNTDPRIGLVTVAGSEEGQSFTAQCVGGDLVEGHTINVKPYILSYTTPHAEMCRADYRLAVSEGQGGRRTLNTDPQKGWVSKPDLVADGGAIGRACAAPNVGVMWYVANGQPNWGVYEDDHGCAVTARTYKGA